MAVKQIAPDVYAVSLGVVNAFLIDRDGLTLVDTGTPGSEGKILAAVAELGKQPSDIRHILVTHCHVDHSGSLAALKQATGAPAYMHPLDATMIREGKAARAMHPAPGLLPALMVRLFIRSAPTMVAPAAVDHEVHDGDELPIAGGIRAIHTPGHCAGQLAFLWPHHGGLLFAADNASHMLGLGLSIVYENLDEGKRSLGKLAALEFEAACFGHGRAISAGASARFRRKWGAAANRSGSDVRIN